MSICFETEIVTTDCGVANKDLIMQMSLLDTTGVHWSGKDCK